MPDTSEIGKLAADVMDAVQQEYGPDAQVGAIGIVVEVFPREGQTVIRTDCSAAQAWIQAGLFDAAREAARARWQQSSNES